MPTFEYAARNRENGQPVTGFLESASSSAAVTTLRERGFIVTSIKQSKKSSAKAVGGVSKKGKRKGKVSSDDLVIFTRQLATIVNAGLPLVEGLNILGEQMENLTFREKIREIEKDVQGGETLTGALAKHPKIFNVLFVNLVKAGEASGMLDEILVQLSIYLEKAASLQRKIKTATIYPSIVITVAIIVVTLLMVRVIPVFENIFESFGGELPLPTRVLIAISHFMRDNFFLGIGILIVGGFLFRRYIKSEKGRFWFDKKLLGLPVLGVLFRKVAVAKFSRTFSTLMRAGVNILVALEIVAKTSGNTVIEKAVFNTRNSIKEGEPITDPLRASAVFPPMVTRMIEIGEKTGSLEEMLGKIADFYEDQVDTAVAGLTSMLEPIMIVFLGVVVGGVVIAMFMPLFKLPTMIAGRK